MDLLSAQMKRDRQLQRAKDESEKYTRQKMAELLFVVIDKVKEYGLDLSVEQRQELNLIVGKEIALAYGIGWMNGRQLSNLKTVSGDDLI